MFILRPMTIVLVAFLAASLLLPAANASVAYDNPLAVFVTVPEGEYDIGSEVTVGIWVFREGVPYDAPLVDLEVGWYYSARAVNVSHIGTGEFEATFTIEERDLEYLSYVYLVAEAQEGTGYYDDDVFGYAYIYLPSLEIDLSLPDPSDQFPVPGELVEFEVRTSFKGSVVDPDPGTLVVELVDSTGKEYELMTERVDTGLYEGGASISSFQRSSETYQIAATAEYTYHSTTQSAAVSIELWSDFYQVFVKVVEATIHGCELEVYTFDKIGRPLVDARVMLNITYYDDALETLNIKVSDYTDLEGKAGFREPFTAVGQDETHVFVYGNVSHEGKTQDFSGRLRVMTPQLEPPSGYGFEVLPLSEDPIVPGATNTVDCFVYYGGDPMPDSEMNIYVMDSREIYYNGNVTTDSQGRLEYQLSIPDDAGNEGSDMDYLVAYYHALMPGYYEDWEYDTISMEVGDPSLRYYTDSTSHSWTKMEVAPYQPGGQVRVTLTDRMANGREERAVVYWGLGSVDDCENMYYRDAPEDWSIWTGSEIEHLYPVPCKWNGEEYEANFTYPEFLPLNTKVFVLGAITFTDGDEPEVRTALAEGLKVDLVPELEVPTSAVPDIASGTIEVNGTASDDNSLESVQYRVDDGEWKGALGTDEWGFSIDTTDYEHGYHILELRCYDGVQYSDVTNISFKVDQPPDVTIELPIEGKKYTGKVIVSGYSEDDGRVHYVELKVDESLWYKCYGIENWTYEISKDSLNVGEHVVQVRSYDGNAYSEVRMVTFAVKEPEQSNTYWYLIGVVIAVIVGVVVALAFVQSRKRSAAAPPPAAGPPGAAGYRIQSDRGGRPVTAPMGMTSGLGGPGAPQGVNVEVGDGKLRVRWGPPMSAGGGQLTGYRLYRGDHRDSLVHLLELVPQATEYEDTGLSNGNSYYYAMSALVNGMEGDMSNIQHGIPIGPPSHPVYPGGHVGENSIVLSWRPPTKSGGSAIRSFVILKGTDPEELKVHAEVGYEFIYEDTEVEKGKTYYYAIMAVNDVGWGEPTQLLIAKME